MQDRYFSAFEFYENKPTPLRLVISPVTERIEIPKQVLPLDIIWEERCDDGGIMGIDLETVEEPEYSWTRRNIQSAFRRQLAEIRHSIGEPSLTMRDRSLHFVSPRQMKPSTEKERKDLLDRYGEYMKDGGAGDCTRHDDGTFTLRVAFGAKPPKLTDNEISIAAHEYGHTLGEQIEDPVTEELKADAFQILFMKHFYRVGSYLISPIPDTVHEIALFRLEQLIITGKMPEEAIIAHLTEGPFGRFSPTDYLAYCNPRQVI